MKYERIKCLGCDGCIFDNKASCERPKEIRDILGPCSGPEGSFQYRLIENKTAHTSLAFKSEKKFTF